MERSVTDVGADHCEWNEMNYLVLENGVPLFLVTLVQRKIIVNELNCILF